MQDLGDLPGGLDLSRAHDVNDAGWVVGYSGGAAGIRATLWQPGSGPVDLNELVAADDPLRAIVQLGIATGVNNAGQIVGSGAIARQGGGFLLTPVGVVPEPATWLMLAAGVCLVQIRRQLRIGDPAGKRRDHRCA